MSIQQVDNFQGNRIQITVDKYSEIVLKNNFDYIENKFGRMLLGTDLWELFLVAKGSNPEPIETRFNIIFNAFVKLNNYNEQYESEGMTKMFNYFTYHLHSNSLNQQITSVGNAQTKIEVGSKNQNAYITQIYNEGVQTYNAIQYYIVQNIVDYPEFTGVKLDYIDNLFI